MVYRLFTNGSINLVAMSIRIRTKIILSFSVIFTILFLLIFMSFYGGNMLYQGAFKLEEEIYEMYLIAGIQNNINDLVMPPNDYLITGDIKEKEKFQAILEKTTAGFEQLDGWVHREHNAQIREAREGFAMLREKAEEIFRIQNPIGNRRGAHLMYEMDALASDTISSHLNRIHRDIRGEVGGLINDADRTKKEVTGFTIIGAVISIITVIILIMYLVKSIVKPIYRFKEGAFIIGGGNLDHRINIRDGLEINLLVDEFNRMTSRLKESHQCLEKKVEERTRELNELNMILRDCSIKDGLTGLYNHKHFYERLEEEIKKARRYNRPFSLIMADIDYFKNYNDTHGHSTGDTLLRQVASTMKKSVRTQDIVARYGGDEFSIILPETGKDGALILAERIRLSIKQLFPLNGTQDSGSLRISLGVATHPDDAGDLATMVEKADSALYLAKKMGRNRVCSGKSS